MPRRPGRGATLLVAAAVVCLAPPRVSADPSTPVEPIANPSPPAAAPPPAASRPIDENPPGVWETPHYDRGFVLLSTPESDTNELQFRLKLNHVSQFKYTNSMNVDATYTDHLGNEHEVLRRNDIQLTRDVFYFSGYVFDRRMDFNILLYTSTATLTATAAGHVGFVFSKAFALRAGFFSLPAVRSLTGNYPFFQGADRSMATNYFRPGFTQGAWANGELFPGFNYIAMIGNSLNTLDIPASKIDSSFAYSASIWYDLNEFGKPWNDWERHSSVALRIGTAFTYAREDRLSDLSTASPENNATFISDGGLLFATGSIATDVTISRANFYLWSIDAGLKYKGLAINAELYQRWLNNFTADGPLPIDKMYDWGFDASAGYFTIPYRLDTYVRGSLVKGPFATGWEAAPGVNVYPFHTRQAWFNAEVIIIRDCPYQSIYYIYSSGQSGYLIPIEFLLRF
jgi:hypothetical protein